MAVTLTISDLQYPTGEMQAIMFPDGDIEDALTSWLTEATTLATDNTAAAHYVYYRGYNAAANRIAAMPSSESTGQGSHSQSWSDGRVKALRDLSNYHKGQFDKTAETADATLPRGYFGRVRA